ncbi:MAG: leucine--tRNA ligase [Candidatus Dormibacteria bacterium]
MSETETGQRRYRPQEIEARWQEEWRRSGLMRADDSAAGPRFYNLVMFPYPSGDLHMGHMLNYLIGDIYSRHLVMRGHNVLNPFGWDAFGLPAEEAAIRRGVHPATWTESNIANMKRQLGVMGVLFDWDREVTTCLPDYYRWTQWIFLLMHRRGLAYRKLAPANWCPSCQTVLANEQVHGGRCWRCDTLVTRRDLEQWFWRITDYADRLLDDLDRLEGWPEHVRQMQRNWIGRSEGAEVQFTAQLNDGSTAPLHVFTTRPDTLFGATFMVLAPEHPLALRIATDAQQAEVRAYAERARLESDIDRLSTERQKTGVFTGGFAVNPVNGERIPVWVADYVLVTYGTGAIMAVPAHDGRDFEFARAFGLPVRQVVGEGAGEPDAPQLGPGRLTNSGQFDGMDAPAGGRAITEWLAGRGLGRAAVQYRLRDWLISRQRYWGAPIPMIDCPGCGIVPVPESDLPVRLPLEVQFRPDGQSPLQHEESFWRVECPSCGGPARRDTDTMDTFVDSSWYYLRYTSPGTTDLPFDSELANSWMPVAQYTGGVEHAIMHLLYSRFVMKVLHDEGMVRDDEPFARLFNQGMMTWNGKVMSKSKGTGYGPDEVVRDYGADTGRVYEMSIGPPEISLDWTDAGIDGSFRWLTRVWRLCLDPGSFEQLPGREPDPPALTRAAHRAIRRVTRDIEGFRFNTAISALHELTNAMVGHLQAGGGEGAEWNVAADALIRLMCPFAPHLAEELWAARGGAGLCARAAWPEFDPTLLQEDTVTLVVQVNGKLRERLEVARGLDQAAALRLALESPRLAQSLGGAEPAKVVFVPDRLLNLVM